MRRLILALLLVAPFAIACVGTGYTCDRGGVEVHVPVDVKRVAELLPEANVVPVGSLWGAEKEKIRVFYSPVKPVLVYAWPGGIRIQIAVKEFVTGREERCVLWANPKDLNVKEVTEKTLKALDGAISLSDAARKKVVGLAGWGLAGNAWIDVKGNQVSVQAVRGCGGFPVYVWKGDAWPKVERKFGDFSAGPAVGLLLLLLGLLLARRKP